ncbi:MAG TPA: xylulokinase [Candidatus Dormibacteraeota bacterium]
MLLGLDIGTAGAHAVAIDESGSVAASASSRYATQSPRPGWTEQDPDDWWRATAQVLAAVARKVHGEIAGLGLTGQRGCVFVDAAGTPVRPAILGSDRRAASQAHYISEQIGARRLIEISGSPALPGHQAPAILWLRDVEPVQLRHTRRVLPAKDYVRLLLTGEAATDAADAAGTLLLDLRRRRWSDEILDALEIPIDWLPKVHQSVEIAGGLRPSLARELGLTPGLPIAAGASQAAAAAIATGIVTGGLVSSSIDAGGVLVAQIDDAVTDPGGRVQTGCAANPGRYHLMGTTPSAGGSLRWWREVLGGRLDDAELFAQAESVTVGADGLFFLPQVDGGGTPLHDAGGAFIGLRAHHTQADLTRALMEGVILSLRDRLDVMRELGVELRQVRATGRAAQSRLWRQMQADIFAVPIATMASTPDPAVGAALLAGIATGVFADVPAASATVARLDTVLRPDPDRVARYDQVYQTFRTLDPAIRQPTAR